MQGNPKGTHTELKGNPVIRLKMLNIYYSYHFYFFVVKFPKFFNFPSSMEKIYLVEFTTFKENAIYGLQEILLDNFPRNFYI